MWASFQCRGTDTTSPWALRRWKDKGETKILVFNELLVFCLMPVILVLSKLLGLITCKGCEGGVDVVGVVTPLVLGGAQVVLHGDQVVELSVLLGVHEKGEVEEDGEGQVEVEREEGEVKERRSCMTMNVDEMRLKNTLSHDVHVTQTSRGVTKLRALSACSQVVQLARVGVRVLVVDVVCVMLVLIALVVVHAVNTQFS